MKKLIILLLLIFSNASTSEIKLIKIIENLDKPWSLTFIDDENIILTERTGKLLILNLKNKKLTEIKHNLSLISLGQGGLLDVLFKDKINGKFKRNKITLDQITGVSAPEPSTKMPGEETQTDRPGPSLSQQADASRGDGEGAKIQKKSISFSKNKPGNASNFFSPEEIDKPETLSTDTTQAARSQTISTSNARPGNSSKAPLTPPGGGLTPPGGGLTPPGGGLTPPSGGLAPPKAGPSDSDTSLITDPNLKPGTKLSLKKN